MARKRGGDLDDSMDVEKERILDVEDRSGVGSQGAAVW